MAIAGSYSDKGLYYSEDVSGNNSIDKVFTRIDSINRRVPVIDKDGDSYFLNGRANLSTGFAKDSERYIAYDSDGSTILHKSIIFNFLVATEDGLFGIKYGEIYLNKVYKDRNDFTLVFRDTNYDLVHDVLLYSPKFGLFYHSKNNKIYRWNGETFVKLFDDTTSKFNITGRTGTTSLEGRFNSETIKHNCLFYVNDFILLINTPTNDKYYFDVKSNTFKLLGNFTEQSIYETSIGTFVICEDYSVKLISFIDSALTITNITHSGYYLDGTVYSDTFEPIVIIEDPVSKIIYLKDSTNTVNTCGAIICKLDDGYKIVHVKCLISYNVNDTISCGNTKKIILFGSNNGTSFNISLTSDKKNIELVNTQPHDISNSYKLFIIDNETYIIDFTNKKLIKLVYDSVTKEIDLEEVYTFQYSDFDSSKLCHGIEGVLWNDLMYLSYKYGSLNDLGKYSNMFVFGKKYYRDLIIETLEKKLIGFTVSYLVSSGLHQATYL